MKKVIGISAVAVLGFGLLAGCSSQPQACGELKTGCRCLDEASASIKANEGDDVYLSVYRSAFDELGRIAGQVSDTSSAREEGISKALADFSLGMANPGNESATVLVTFANLDIEEVCGFSLMPSSADDQEDAGS